MHVVQIFCILKNDEETPLPLEKRTRAQAETVTTNTTNSGSSTIEDTLNSINTCVKKILQRVLEQQFGDLTQTNPTKIETTNRQEPFVCKQLTTSEYIELKALGLPIESYAGLVDVETSLEEHSYLATVVSAKLISVADTFYNIHNFRQQF